MKRLILVLCVLISCATTGQTLKTTINNNILNQGTKGITATKLKNALYALADSVGNGVTLSELNDGIYALKSTVVNTSHLIVNPGVNGTSDGKILTGNNLGWATWQDNKAVMGLNFDSMNGQLSWSENGNPNIANFDDRYLTKDTPIFSGTITGNQFALSALNTAPASATDTGVLGEIRITATHIYFCKAANTWVRAALSSW